MKSLPSITLRGAQSIFAELLRNAPPPQRWNPHAYQKKYMKMLVSQACVMGWLDPGLGKTSCSLGAFKMLQRAKMVRRMLVIAPLRVCYLVWPKELLKWTEFNELRMVVLHGSQKDNLLDENADVFVINPEGLDWFVAADGMRRVQPDVLCIDESRKFSNTQAKRFKIMKPLIDKFRRRWTLTGTPDPQGDYLDLFGQVYLTDGGAAFGSYITHYRNQYFQSTGYGGYEYKLMNGADKVIQTKLKPLVMRLDANDYLKLPKLISNDVEVVLPPKARRVYDDMEDIMLSILDKKGTNVSAGSAAAASNKCQQIANGGLYLMPETDDEGLFLKNTKREWVTLHDEKIKAVDDLMDEIGSKGALIAYHFEHDLAALLKHFGKNVPRIGVNLKQDMKLEAMWNRGELPVLLGHPMSMGHGLNLQEGGNDVIWFSNTYDLELYDQFNKRVLRQGSNHEVVRVHRIIARNTVDEVMIKALATKDTNQRALLNSLRLHIKSRRVQTA